MSEEANSQDSPSERYRKELLAGLTNPTHKRLIEAYQGDNPVQSMEAELGKILMEALHRED